MPSSSPPNTNRLKNFYQGLAVRLLLQDLHHERHGFLGPFYQPGKLLGALLPPLVVVRLFAKRFTRPLDFLLFLLIWPRLVYERVLIWRWALSKRRLII